MRELFIYLIFVINLIKSNIIDDSIFRRFQTDLILQTPVTIGNFQYNYLWLKQTEFNFSCQSQYDYLFKNLTYPLVVDVPNGALSQGIRLKVLDKSISGAMKIFEEIQKIINDLKINKNDPVFEMAYGISIKPLKEDENLQLLIVWCTKKTYAIINFFDKGLSKINLNIGRGLSQYDYSNDIKETNKVKYRLIYDISTNKIIKVGCQRVSNETNRTFQLVMSKYRLSSLGGENLYLQGPCIDDLAIASLQMLEIKRKSYGNVMKKSMEFNKDSHSFYLITPFIWFPGIYEFKISFNDFNFISDVEIYSYQNPSQKYEFKWNESSQMNNPDFNKTEITLWPIPNPPIKSLTFYLVDMINSDEVNVPLLSSNPVPFTNILGLYIEIPLQHLYLKDIDVLKHIGFLAMTDIYNETKWTEPFSLIWLTKFTKKLFDESICQKYLSNSNKNQQYFCPSDSDKVVGLQSTFRKWDFSFNLFSNELDQYDCFHEVLWGSNKVEFKERGITCCYFRDSKYLVYGQDFYRRNRKTFGSYSWSVSPFNNLLKHFLHDQIPILSCCILIINETLCTNYWNQYHQIYLTDTTKRDNIAEVFGDPHFIPFKATSNYSFLGLGQYDMIQTNNKEFQLQGRFFYELRQSSSLKAIAFSIPSSVVVITTSSNDISTLQWKILIRKSNIESHRIIILPFKDENLNIFQSEETAKLFIYIRLNQGSNIYIELERFPCYKTLLEYINMKINLPNSLQETISGGLFGKIDNNPATTSIYKRKSDTSLPEDSLTDLSEMYNFALTWQPNPEDNLFFDMAFSENPAQFRLPVIQNYSQCENLNICNIDKTLYEEDTMYISTSKAYNTRKKLDINWIQSLSNGNICNHPKWKLIRLNSTNYMEGQSINISGCLDPLMEMKNPIQVITCEKNSNGKMEWRPNPSVDGEICKDISIKPKDDSTDPVINSGMIMYAAVGASVLFIIILSFAIIGGLIMRKNRRNRSTSKVNLGISLNSSIPMDDIYDNYIPNIEMADEYATYAQIQKTVKP